MHTEIQKVGLKMNIKKTKLMFNNYIVKYEIKINDELIECVKEKFT